MTTNIKNIVIVLLLLVIGVMGYLKGCTPEFSQKQSFTETPESSSLNQSETDNILRLTAENESLREEKSQLLQRIADQDKQKSTATAVSQDTPVGGDGEINNTLNTLRVSLDEANTRVDQLSQERDGLVIDLQSLKAQLAEKSTADGSFKDDDSDIRIALEKLTDEIDALHVKYVDSVAESDTAKHTTTDENFVDTFDRYSGRLSQLKLALATTQSIQEEETTAKLTQLSSDLTDARNQVAELNLTNKELVGNLEGKDKELVLLNDKIAALTESEAKTNSTFQEKILAQQQANEVLEGKLTALGSSRDLLKTELENWRNTVDSLSLDKQQMDELIESTQSALSGLQQEKQKIGSKVFDLETRLEKQRLNHDIKVQSLEQEVTLIRIGNEIAYRFGSAQLNQEGKDILNIIAELLNEYPQRIVSLEGHTDNIPMKQVGSPYPSNWELSAARASRAARYLIARGIDPTRMQVVGFGSSRPLSENDTEENRAMNRRLEVRLVPGNPRELVKSL